MSTFLLHLKRQRTCFTANLCPKERKERNKDSWSISECLPLKWEIETLIRCGWFKLKDFAKLSPCVRACMCVYVWLSHTLCFGSSGGALTNLDCTSPEMLKKHTRKIHNWRVVTHLGCLPSPVSKEASETEVQEECMFVLKSTFCHTCAKSGLSPACVPTYGG